MPGSKREKISRRLERFLSRDSSRRSLANESLTISLKDKRDPKSIASEDVQALQPKGINSVAQSSSASLSSSVGTYRSNNSESVDVAGPSLGVNNNKNGNVSLQWIDLSAMTIKFGNITVTGNTNGHYSVQNASGWMSTGMTSKEFLEHQRYMIEKQIELEKVGLDQASKEMSTGGASVSG